MEASKIKKDKGKTTYFFLFHFIFVKMKKFFTILALKQPNSWESILVVLFEKIIDKDSFA